MERYGKWEIIQPPIGAGGQGTVYRARNTEEISLDKIRGEIRKALRQFTPTSYEDEQLKAGEEIAKSILAFAKVEDMSHCSALKILHSSKDDKGYQKQLERMKSEVAALRSLSHPNIIPILDEKLGERWFVTEFYPEGSLSNHLDSYRGDILASLVAFRPLVEAVARMHEAKLIHRDIKPDNVFCKDGKLILGDLGLVFFSDGKQSRVSDTLENVGSRDWMPGWAMGMRVEEIRPSFDVFSLGKLFWSMLSGKPLLQLWYHHDPRFDLEIMFPKDREMRWASEILDPCVVEREGNCLSDAKELLAIIDAILPALRRHSQVVAEDKDRVCRVCGLGTYVYVVNENHTDLRNFGINAVSGNDFKIFTCNNCGHVELFHIPYRVKPRAWR